MAKKGFSIDYTSRDFDSIRGDLENYARRYYPDSYQDFNQASFGSLMLDTVSYVGDILSFYVDYQANESFLDSAVEYNNVVRLARQLGFRLKSSPSSFGLLTFYLQIPALSNGLGPDTQYTPIMEAGSEFLSLGGGSYTLIDNVDFGSRATQIVVGSVDSATGNPINYIVRAKGRAVSGRVSRETFEIGDFQKFLQLRLNANNVSEVIKVTDSDGNEYFEVDNLSQNIIYKPVRNLTATRTSVSNILKAVPVARRFTLENQNNFVTLQFGYGSESELLTDSVVDPTEVVLDLNGRNYSTDKDFDPTKLIGTDKFGIAPSNTTLIVDYRHNTIADANAAINTITTKGAAFFKFPSQGSLSRNTRNTVTKSLEITNETPFMGNIALPSAEEIRTRAIGYFATQNRAVTLEDYKFITYGMPGKYGAVYRVGVVRDFNEFRRNLNIYVMSINQSKKLEAPNITLKNNLKTWLSQYKMINDTIDILDATTVNFGVNYEIVSDKSKSRYTLLATATSALTRHFSRHYDIGESVDVADIVRALQGVDGVADVTNVKFVLKDGGIYANSSYNLQGHISADGRVLKAENNIIFELKFPNVDIKGSVR